MSEHECRSPQRTCRGSGDGSTEEAPSSLVAPAKSALSECLSTWIQYLQMLNGLSSAGSKLSHCFITLAQEQNAQPGTQGFSSRGSPYPALQITSQCLAGWDELTRATVIATNTVKSHTVASLQQYMNATLALGALGDPLDSDCVRVRENCQQIICENVHSLISLQYQFCIAYAECLGTMATCPCCHTSSGNPHEPECSMSAIQHTFSRFYAAPPQEPRSQTASPPSSNAPLNLSQGSLDSLRNCIDPNRLQNLLSETHHQRSALIGTERSIESPRNNPHISGLCYERNQYSQGSVSSLDSPKSSYMYSSEHYRGPSPTLVHSDYFRSGPTTESVRSSEPRGHSPLPTSNDTYRGPSPVQGYSESYRGGHLETMRGPFPNPGGLLSMKTPFLKTVRSPMHYPLFPLNGQRRWSEAAAGEVATSVSDDGTMRRWSMPWDGGKCSGAQSSYSVGRKSKTQSSGASMQHALSQDRSRSATPEWQSSTIGGVGNITSEDGLAEAIQLLSCRPGVRPPQIVPPSAALPMLGVTDVWSEDMKNDGARHISNPPISSRWAISRRSESSGSSGGDGTNESVPMSSDSSARSSGGTAAALFEPNENLRNFSIWSGNDAMPFLKLPESHEPDMQQDWPAPV